ncbi:hypothetical protein PRIC1_010562 [Phytophthora ramorum]
MGPRKGSRGMITKLVLVSLLAVSCIATTHAAEQSFEMISKLRGFSREAFEQQQGFAFNSAIATRRLDAAATQADASAKANEVGASVRKAIKQLRKGTDKFYHDLITAAKIYMCEQDIKNNKKGPTVRYVSCTADNAYKDDNGNPVKLTISDLTDSDVVKNYGQGLCEINPDCYWDEILPGDTTRAKVYADADSTMNASAADAQIKEWLTGVVGFVIPGIVLGVLSLLTMVFFLICRCCCNRCGGRFPREEGYTCMQKFLPLLFFLLFAIGIIAVSAAAFVYQGIMVSGVDDLFNATSGTLDNGSDWIVSIRTPMEEIGAQVISSSGSVKAKLADTGFIDTGLTDITGKLRAIGTNYGGTRKFPTGCTADSSNPNSCLECKACSQIGTKATTAADQVDQTTGPGVKQLSNVKKQLNTQLVDISETVQSSVDTQVGTANVFIGTIDDTKGDVTDYDKKFQKYRDMLVYAIMSLFILALLVVVIGFVGILFGLTPLKALANIMHIAYFIGFIVLFITFIISAIVLALGVVLGDACEVTMIFTANWTVPLGDSAKALDACFQDESLLDVFNLSDKLSFARGGIEFPDLDMDSVLDFSQLNTFSGEMASVSTASFGFSDSDFTTFQTGFNSYAVQTAGACQTTGTGYGTVAKILDPWTTNGDTRVGTETAVQYIKRYYTTFDASCTGTGGNGKAYTCSSSTCTFSTYMGEQFQLLFNMASSKNFVDNLHTDVNGVTTSTTDFSTKTKQFDGAINDIKTDLNSNLIKYVGEFEEAMHCTFLADGFWEIYNTLCGDLMPAITMIALMLFLCGIFLIAVNVCLIIGVKRLKAHGNGHIMDTEMKFK